MNTDCKNIARMRMRICKSDTHILRMQLRILQVTASASVWTPLIIITLVNRLVMQQI
jgi:hypothetical protein